MIATAEPQAVEDVDESQTVLVADPVVERIQGRVEKASSVIAEIGRIQAFLAAPYDVTGYIGYRKPLQQEQINALFAEGLGLILKARVGELKQIVGE